MRTIDVAIVGAGLTGAILAMELLGRMPRGSTLALVGRPESFGRGVAYGTADPDHRLNVPAARMSLYMSDPLDFVRWLGHDAETALTAGEAHGAAFAPRRTYGRYLADRLAEAERRAAGRVKLLRIADTALEAGLTAGGYRIDLAEQAPLRAAGLALCLGNAPAALPVPPAAIDPAARGRIVVDPWGEAGVAAVAPDEDVLFVGTGLTMVDLALTLARRGHRGRLLALSRRGLMPIGHSDPRPAPHAPAPPVGADLAGLVRWVRRAVAAEAAAGGDWQAVVDGLRPHTQALWGALGAVDRRRFLRHLATHWGVHRHRMAPAVARRIAALVEDGRLASIAGRLEGIAASPDGRLAARVRRRGAATAEPIAVDRIVNCCGLDRSPVASREPLMQSLLDGGIARADALGLGLDVTAESRLLRRDGAVADTAFALGPLTVGRFWEIVAVPDIRVQCRDVAETLATTLAAARTRAAG